MSLWKKAKRALVVNRLVEEEIYARVLEEVESGYRRDGLWAKALRKGLGDEQKAKAYYIEYRVQSIKDEMEITEALTEKAQEQEQKANEQERLRIQESRRRVEEKKDRMMKVAEEQRKRELREQKEKKLREERAKAKAKFEEERDKEQKRKEEIKRAEHLERLLKETSRECRYCKHFVQYPAVYKIKSSCSLHRQVTTAVLTCDSYELVEPRTAHPQ